MFLILKTGYGLLWFLYKSDLRISLQEIIDSFPRKNENNFHNMKVFKNPGYHCESCLTIFAYALSAQCTF